MLDKTSYIKNAKYGNIEGKLCRRIIKWRIAQKMKLEMRPDGWYFPKDNGKPAIILETKSEKEDISLKKWEEEMQGKCK